MPLVPINLEVLTCVVAGEVGEEDDIIDQDRDWCEYWRLLFPKITVKDIEEFEKKYKGRFHFELSQVCVCVCVNVCFENNTNRWKEKPNAVLLILQN